MEARDAETGESVFLPLEVKFRDGRLERRVAPCLLPELDLLSEVVTRSPRYYPLSFSVGAEEGGEEGGRENRRRTRRRGGPRMFEGPRRQIRVKRKPGGWGLGLGARAGGRGAEWLEGGGRLR